MYETDPRIVLTLDAGGTNLIFSAIAGNREIVEPVHFHSVPDDLDRMLSTLVEGFEAVRRQLDAAPVAISFAFPGPADYAHGIIGDLPNFPSFRGGVALGPFLERKFGIPVFINNDGNLFAYGEAISGALPEVNTLLERSGSTKRYRNLLGVTLGTGFGAGAVIDGRLLTGDNGCGGDVWVFRNKHHEGMICEESVSIRAVRRVYGEITGSDAAHLTPRDIFDIAEGTRPGDREAARESFRRFGEVAGDVISQALTIIDGIVVLDEAYIDFADGGGFLPNTSCPPCWRRCAERSAPSPVTVSRGCRCRPMTSTHRRRLRSSCARSRCRWPFRTPKSMSATTTSGRPPSSARNSVPAGPSHWAPTLSPSRSSTGDNNARRPNTPDRTDPNKPTEEP